MKFKNVKLEWYIMQHDFNKDEIYMCNILNGWEEKIYKKIKKGDKDKWNPVTDYESFKDWILREISYYYRSKTESEILVSGLFSKKESYKIDGYFQVKPNIDNMCQMIIQKMDISFD